MIFDNVIIFLNQWPDMILNIIDVGCHKAGFLNGFKPKIEKDTFWIGIDACDFNVRRKFNVFVNKAIDNIENDQVRKFNEYVESGCNSLLPMNMDILTGDNSEYDKKWYIGKTKEQLTIVREQKTTVRDVNVTSLHSVLSYIPRFKNDLIHFVKIDTQGNDINVVKSMKEYRDKTMFIQMECVSSHNKDIVLYKGQQLMEDDIKDMDELGFTVYDFVDYSINKNAPPEADVVFYNKRLVELE